MFQRTPPHTMSTPVPRPAMRPEPTSRHLHIVEAEPPLRGLHACESLDEVERLMVELAQRSPDDVLGRIAAEHLGTGGKRLRARLSLAALETLGGARELAVGWAAACELLHNATLIHDDLQDGDRVRRGRPAVWARHGAAQAINAGDMLLMLPFLALGRLDVEAELRWQLTRVLADCATHVARGQAAEVALDRTERPDWPTYRSIVAGKTGALFQLPVEGAALLAGRSPAVARALALDFQRLGVIFQLQDDVLDLYGDKGRASPGSDICEGKVTALVLEYLHRVPGDRGWLLEILAAPRDATRTEDVDEAIRRFRTHGALAAVLARIDVEADAVASSPALAAEPEARKLAIDLAREILRPISHLYRHPGSDSLAAADAAARSARAGEVA